MSDDIVARLREEHYKFAVVPRENKLEMSRQTVGRLASLWREAADEIERLRAERDEARLQTRQILSEIDCRIEHGADSGGHLEAIRNLFREATDGK